MLFFGKKTKTKLVKHKKVKLGIAFGGGGARGAAHIGAVKAFEELGVEFDYIAGTSVGSFIGAALAAGLSAEEMTNVALKLKAKDIKTNKIPFKPSRAVGLMDTVSSVLGEEMTFEKLKKPFIAVVVDLKCGEEVHLSRGLVAPAVAGSCAVPGIFTPVVHDGMHLVDGGLKNNVPADVVRKMGADKVIAIDVNHKRGSGTEKLSVFGVIGSTIGVMVQENTKNRLKMADLVLKPDLSEFSSSKLQGMEKMIEIGYETVMENKDKILDLISTKLPRKKKKLWQTRMQSL